MSHRTLLLFPHLGVELAIIGRALRDAGHLVFPARFHEDSVDALVRVRPTLVLIEATHHGKVVTPQFRALAEETGATVIVYSRNGGDGDAATLRESGAEAYPVIDFSGQGRALVGLLAEVPGGHAA